MKPHEFVELALKTESNDFEAIMSRLWDERTLRLLHAGMGLVTEAAEFMDALKKYIFYGKPIDEVNLKEELGDSDWYKAIAIDELGTTQEEVWEMVINKLKARYGDKFNSKGALVRDLDKERNILENNNKPDDTTKIEKGKQCPNCHYYNPTNYYSSTDNATSFCTKCGQVY